MSFTKEKDGDKTKYVFLADKQIRLDLFLHENLENLFSRAKIQKTIKDGYVTVDNKVSQKPSRILSSGSQIEVIIIEEKPAELKPLNLGIPILFQDEYIAVLHKPAGMTVHPGINTKEDTLVHSLLAQIKELSDGTMPDRPGIIHRLDRETEGVILIAKTNQSHHLFSKLFQERKIKKEYLAFIWGRITSDKTRISGFIGRHPVNRKKMRFSEKQIHPQDKEAVLEYETERACESFSKLKINLLTGRTHQIRATFASSGNYIVGDSLYSKDARQYKKYNISKETQDAISEYGMLLSAMKLEFVHPFTDKHMSFSIEVPKRFLDFEETYFCSRTLSF
ncbi:MAG: RluA family pseudouridine synthase [Spirochaetia bacterium]|nr:RluA family pseudouridine synthase [Spirochaetia bacterium]